MYTFSISEVVKEDLRKASKIAISIHNKMVLLSANPLSDAIRTEIANIGEYYVNAGRYCLVYDVDIEREKIILRSVPLSVLLHKIITCRIDTSQGMIAISEGGEMKESKK